MAQRIVTGALLVVFLVLALYLGGWYFAAAAFIAVALCLHEELGALRTAGHRPVRWTSYAGLAISAPLMMYYSSMVIIPILTILSFCVLLQIMRREEPDLMDVVTSVFPMLSLVLPAMCLFGIMDAQQEGRAYQTLLLAMTFAIAVGGDTFAYFIGSRFGRHKLCPRISPNKTVEGAAAGLAGSVLCAYLVGLGFQLALPNHTFPPFWGNLIVGLVGGVAGQMGDLFASMVKRHCGVKDFGTLFPGHGGMLDRMDSILFTAIIVYCYKVILATALYM